MLKQDSRTVQSPPRGRALSGLLAEDRLTEVVGQPLEVLVVFLADVLRQLTVGAPRDVPRDAKRLAVRARIVDQRLVMQRLLARPREAFDDVQLIGVRVAEVVEPRRLVEADDVDDQRVTVPMPDGVSEI